jgi:hypothetical protein
LKLKSGVEMSNTKIIGVNTQACNNMNWYLLADRNDPGKHLEWLENELKEIESVNG